MRWFRQTTLSLEFINSLPFKLTDAQQRVIFEIRRDLGQTVPMNRFGQGDVGAGKTVVAATVMVAAVKSGSTECVDGAD